MYTSFRKVVKARPKEIYCVDKLPDNVLFVPEELVRNNIHTHV